MIESPQWFKSSYSNNGGDCIEVATNPVVTHSGVAVRDSKIQAGPILDFPADAFSLFVASIKAAEFGAI
ncbi:DUF397 domain-containing protein [Streptomyces sp. NPDC056716]|uniref:DUF397 domain-containing protein n=1 Tax=unclassified Streptomyces TaxID=2593676 RepID=UPI00369AA843